MPKEITTLESVKARSLKDTSFTETEDTVKQRLIIAIDGETGSGKNRLAFSFPDPIAFLSFDPNYAKTLKEARAQRKRIYRASYSLPVIKPDGRNADAIASAAGDLWDHVAVDFMGAIRDSKVQTIIVDTATELFELIKLAIYGKTVQVMQRDLGHAYATYRQFIREVESSDKNLVLIHKMKDEYKQDKSTGNRIRAGYKDTAYSVVMEMLMYKNMEEAFPDRYHAVVQKCHLQPEIEGQDISGDLISFETLQTLVWG